MIPAGSLFLYCLGRCYGGCSGCMANSAVTREEARRAILYAYKFLKTNPDLYFNKLILETGGILESSSLDDIIELKEKMKYIFSRAKIILANVPFTTIEKEKKAMDILVEMMGTGNILVFTHPIAYDSEDFKYQFIKKSWEWSEFTYNTYRSRGIMVFAVPILLYSRLSKKTMREFIKLNLDVEKLNFIDIAGTGFINSIFNKNLEKNIQFSILKEFYQEYSTLNLPVFLPFTLEEPYFLDLSKDRTVRTTLLEIHLNFVIDGEGVFQTTGDPYILGSSLGSKNKIDITSSLDLDKIIKPKTYVRCSRCKIQHICELTGINKTHAPLSKEFKVECLFKTVTSSLKNIDKEYAVLTEEDILAFLDYYETPEKLVKLFEYPITTIAVIRDILALYSPNYATSSVCVETNHIFVRSENLKSITPNVKKKIYKLYYKNPHLFKNFLKIKRNSNGFFGVEGD